MKKLFTAFCFLLTFHFGFSQTFTGGTGLILDYQTIEIPLIVSGLPNSIDTINFGLEQICLNLEHTYLSDLEISLIAPDGTTSMLASNIGGGEDNFTNTCLRSDAAVSIGAGTAPFSGTFLAMSEFGRVNNGQNPNGTWLLRITDYYGGDEGTVIDWSLTFGADPADYFGFSESSLPIVLINTNGQQIWDDPKVEADMQIIYNGPGIRNHVSDTPNEYNGKIGIEQRGNYSASLPQKPYALELRDANSNEVNFSLLGMPSEHDWLLIANYNDKSFARNVVPCQIFDTMGHYATRSRHVDVVLNGEYKGIYLLCEKIKRDSMRVDIGKLAPTDISGRNLTGGYIVKIDYWDAANSWQLNYSPIGYPGLDIHMVYYYPKVEDLVPEQINYIQSFFNDFETALYGPDFDDPAEGYRKYIDVTSFIDYFLISELTRNVDGYKKSHFFSKDKDAADGTLGKLHAGPVWDFDWSQKDMWGGSEDGSAFMYGDVAQDVNAPGWYIRLLQDTNFTRELRCRYEDLRRNILSENYIHQGIDSVAHVVSESQSWHYLTWGHMGAATGTPETDSPSQSYAEEVQRLKDWYTRRLTWLDANIPGTLNGCHFAGTVENTTDFSIRVAPNPFKNSIYVSSPETAVISIQLLDQSGRKLEIQQSGDPKQIIVKTGENLSSGIYYLQVETAQGTGTYKIVRQ
ncbi:MAG: CotH kinase family protein [Bacteroidota bacterium]